MMMVSEAVGMAVIMVMVMIVGVLVVVCVVHASIPLAGSAMCSNMVESRLLMWASAAE
jgi:hypothetical protein